ncbi:activator of basal transcription 1-like [Centruroides vittatus]|uniref:activator of basal transcription 1-like n=1 Tax=Centruroides vittatus TaxID=120091 RepID=UPI0035101576
MAASNTEQEELTVDTINKKIEPGVVYLSYIPPYMTVKQIREYFSKFGEIGRIYLQPEKGNSKKFSEGWVEFKNKRIGKRTASMLNGNQVGGRRRAPYYHCLWSIKYLHKFKWYHLSEKIAYERASRSQKMRAEISQAKQEKEWFKKMLEVKRRLKT